MMKRTISGMIGAGSLAHNRRDFVAENVDPDRVQLNICYKNENLKEVYKELFDDAVDYEYTFEPIKGSPIEFAYRNKMEFSFGDEYKDGPLSLGLHKKGSTYDVLNAEDCKLVHEDMDKILSCVLHYFRERRVSYYHKMQHTGYLRHLLLRRGSRTGEILVNLVTTSQEEYDLDPVSYTHLTLPTNSLV